MVSRAKHRFPRSVKILIIILGSLCLSFFIFLHLAIEGFKEWSARDYGHIRLPNNYEITALSAKKRVLDHDYVDSEGSRYSDGIVVDSDIDAVAWNERYVFFHISGRENVTEHYQVLDTQTKELSAFKTMAEAKLALKKLHADSLELKYTFDFFPETRASSPQPFQPEA